MNKFQRNIFSVALMVFMGAPFFMSAQYKADSVYTKQILMEDLRQLREAIMEINPDPYIFCSESDVNKAWGNAEYAVKKGMTGAEFQKLVARTIRVFHDSHTSLSFQSAAANYRANKGYILNFGVWSADDEIVVTRDRLNILPKGTVLVRINGVSAKKLHNDVAAYSIYEGNSITGFKRITDALYPTFLCLETSIGAENTFLVKLPGEEKNTEVSYPGYTSKQQKKLMKSIKTSMYELTVLEEEKAAVIRIGSFSYGSQGKYQRFLKKSFKEINKRGIEHVAIDLRNNTGGNSGRMESLLSYLNFDDVRVPDNLVGKQSKASKERYDNTFSKWNRFLLRTFGQKNEDARNYTYLADRPVGSIDTIYFDTPEEAPKFQFKGTNYLFMNGLSGSASSNFAGVFRTKDLGTIIGESCLGPVGGTWGNPVNQKLDNTGVKVIISSIRFNNDRTFEYSPRPVSPDIKVEKTRKSISDEVDLSLEKLKEVINGNNGQ